VDVDAFRDRTTCEERKNLRKNLHLEDEDFVAVLAAEFRMEKGHDTAFMAVNEVKRHGKNIKLILLGDGEKEPELRVLAQQLVLEENIRWEGYQKDIRPYLGICDAVLISSYAESFSMSMLEALAAGCPVVATHVGGADEVIVESHNGLLVKPGDPISMAEAFETMIENVELRRQMGENAHASVAGDFDVEGMTRKIEALLESMVPTSHE